jgi:hypothetical protein
VAAKLKRMLKKKKRITENTEEQREHRDQLKGQGLEAAPYLLPLTDGLKRMLKKSASALRTEGPGLKRVLKKSPTPRGDSLSG